MKDFFIDILMMFVVVMISIMIVDFAKADGLRLGYGSENTQGALGYNDYVPENAFKNNLSEQGYTQVWDSDPGRSDVVAVSYWGLRGDPSKEDVDYVLKSEFERLNASEQADSIERNTSSIFANNWNNAWKNLQQDGNIVQNGAKIAENTKEIAENAKAISDNVKRINDLEDRKAFKGSFTLNTILYDDKWYRLNAFGKYDTNKESELGVMITIKLTKSYEEKQLERQEVRLKRLEAQVLMLNK